MEMKIFLIILLITILSVTCSGLTFYHDFRYAPGRCEEISLNNVLDETLRSELRALLYPQIRYSRKKVLYYDLYTKQNPNDRQLLNYGDSEALKLSNFNRNWPVRFLIHGWRGKSTICSNAAVKDAYLSRGDFNVIIVDWSAHSLDISYRRISRQLKDIAANLVKFLLFLHKETGVPFEQIYLIGHSAGSHISGLAGKLLQPQRLGAIIALDPAGLTQLYLDRDKRLAADDALYVESIHTDITLLGNPNTDLSQAAFFPNWGHGQPQCPNATAVEFDFTCDHFSALYYFAESIRNSKLFGAVQCKLMSNNIEKMPITSEVSRTPTATATATTTQQQNLQTLKRNDKYINKGNNNSNDKKNVKCSCPNNAKQCAAEVYFGGEPVLPKRGVFYFSTHKQAPFGFGNIVQTKPRKMPSFVQSRLTGEITKRYFRI